MKKIIKKFIYVAALTALFVPANVKANTAVNMLREGGLAYAVFLGGIVVHELGHAVMAKMLTDSPINVTIGAPTKSPLFTLGGVKFNSLLSSVAFCTWRPYSNGDIVAVTAAGPIAGYLFAGTAISLASSPIVALAGVYHLLMNTVSLIPDGYNDGAQIYKALQSMS